MVLVEGVFVLYRPWTTSVHACSSSTRTSCPSHTTSRGFFEFIARDISILFLQRFNQCFHGDYLLYTIRICTSKNKTILKISFPVSYTHLRAHETRHDLVCRLLLEKK